MGEIAFDRHNARPALAMPPSSARSSMRISSRTTSGCRHGWARNRAGRHDIHPERAGRGRARIVSRRHLAAHAAAGRAGPRVGHPGPQAGAEPAQAADGACPRPPAAPADLHHRRPPVRYHVPGQLHRPDARRLIPPGAQADQGRRAVRVRRVVERTAQRRGLQDLLFGSAARRAGRRPPLRREKSREWLRSAVPGGGAACGPVRAYHPGRPGRDRVARRAAVARGVVGGDGQTRSWRAALGAVPAVVGGA